MFRKKFVELFISSLNINTRRGNFRVLNCFIKWFKFIALSTHTDHWVVGFRSVEQNIIILVILLFFKIHLWSYLILSTFKWEEVFRLLIAFEVSRIVLSPPHILMLIHQPQSLTSFLRRHLLISSPAWIKLIGRYTRAFNWWVSYFAQLRYIDAFH